MTRERDLRDRILLEASEAGDRLLRQNVGLGWVGRAEKLGGGDVLIHGARPLHAGLCRGSSDLIGWSPRVINGQRIAVFTAVELKTGRQQLTDEQRRFLDAVERAGGIARVIREDDRY